MRLHRNRRTPGVTSTMIVRLGVSRFETSQCIFSNREH